MKNLMCKLFRDILLSLWPVFSFCSSIVAAEPTYKEGESIFIETGVEAPDRNRPGMHPWSPSRMLQYSRCWPRKARQGRYYPYTIRLR